MDRMYCVNGWTIRFWAYYTEVHVGSYKESEARRMLDLLYDPAPAPTIEDDMDVVVHEARWCGLVPSRLKRLWWRIRPPANTFYGLSSGDRFISMALQSFRSGEPNAELAEIAGLKRIRTEYRRGIPLPRFEGQVEFTLNGTRIRAIAVEPKNEWDYRTVRFEEVVSKETAA